MDNNSSATLEQLPGIIQNQKKTVMSLKRWMLPQNHLLWHYRNKKSPPIILVDFFRQFSDCFNIPNMI